MSGHEKKPAPMPIETLVHNALGKGIHIDALAARLAEIERNRQPQPTKKGGA